MQFETCLTCPAIKEKRCTGPKFMRAPTKDIVEWLFAYMRLNGITNAALAATSGIPKGTIDGLKNRTDVRHETMYPLLKTAVEMTGGVWDGEYCPMEYNAGNDSESQQELEHMKELLATRDRTLKERTVAMFFLAGLCAGLVLLLMLFHL